MSKLPQTGMISIFVGRYSLRILDHTTDPDFTSPVELVRPENLPSAKMFGTGFSVMPSDAEIEWKVVIVVRKDLNMGVGKIAAQCAHAAVGIYKRLAQSSVANLQKWEKNGQKKVVVGVDSEQELYVLILCNKNSPIFIKN